MQKRRMIAACCLVLLSAVTLEAEAARTIPLDQATLADIDAAFKAGTLTSEKLVQMSLARIEALDHQGPRLNAILAINPKALETARALDAERKAKGPRSPLHGIPVILKDNYNTVDMPTTGGSVLLEGSMPPADAFLVKKLRDAGAIILAKANMSEFASAAPMSSLGGQSHNPHDLDRTPSGSSGGTGVAIAADYAVIGMGTDTGGSIRGPASVNGVVALKPTLGLLSRAGIIPLALSFDTGGPFARNVADVAAALSVMTGQDPQDSATKSSAGNTPADYLKGLDINALKGARIGVARDFMGQDQDVDWVVESSIAAMKRAGATIIDVTYPKWLIEAKGEFYNAIRYPEFTVQIADYLSTLGPKYPKSLADMIERADHVTSTRSDGAGTNPSRWTLFKRELKSGSLTDSSYTAVHDHALPLVRAAIEGIFAANKLDAIIYPTSSKRPALLSAPQDAPGGPATSATNIANLTGFPDLIVPAGFTGDRLPVGLSFFGRAFSEQKLLALGYAFEQATKARRQPIHAPALADEMITLP